MKVSEISQTIFIQQRHDSVNNSSELAYGKTRQRVQLLLEGKVCISRRLKKKLYIQSVGQA
jgi:hypothetical protein